MPAPYKSLVLCFDGTWNDLKSNTNVSRLYSEIADASTGCTRQQKFYDEGVGTHWYDRVRGGAFGMGLDHNIRLGYAWLATTFESGPVIDRTVVVGGEPGDAAGVAAGMAAADARAAPRKPNGDLFGCPPHSSGADFLVGSDIYLFGFSRGAYTARSLGGLINYLGIPVIDTTTVPPEGALADHPVIRQAWDLYANRPGTDDESAVRAGTASPEVAARVQPYVDQVDAFRRTRSRFPVRIHFVGVWDTVGALGIPKVAWIPKSTKYEFHDTSLGQCIRNAFHAVAIDEHRQEYKATLWSKRAATTEAVQQRWFSGAHADVGGGYPDDLLPAKPLLWLSQCAAGCGLEFVNDRGLADAEGIVRPSVATAPAAFDLIGTEYMSPVHDSYAEFMKGAYSLIQHLPGNPGRVYRRMLVNADGVGQEIDETAFQKWKADPEYRPPNLGQAGRQDVTYSVARDDDVTMVVMRSPAKPIAAEGGAA